MTREMMISAGDFTVSAFGADAELEIEDDGSAYITTPHAVLEGFFSFDRDRATRLTLIP